VRNIKEIMALIILIFVVMVSAAEAEITTLHFSTEIDSELIFSGRNDSERKVYDYSNIDLIKSENSRIELSLDTSSSLSELPDEFSLVVMLTALF